MCYNVLCDKYCTRQLYGYCPSWALDWEYRKVAIMKEILHYGADIVSLQVSVETCKLFIHSDHTGPSSYNYCGQKGLRIFETLCDFGPVVKTTATMIASRLITSSLFWLNNNAQNY